MTDKAARYREKLGSLADWEAFLLNESGLPGPRANLELVQVVADLGDLKRFQRWLKLNQQAAPVNAPEVFLVVCGAVGLGRLIAEGKTQHVAALRRLASDSRWRVREGVVLGLQRWGDADLPALLAEMTCWAEGNWLEQRAVVAALCEPRLLNHPTHAARVLELLDAITAHLAAATQRDANFKVLRQTLGYGWSVAVAALPAAGKPAFETWLTSANLDVRWLLKENLKKNRLVELDAAWVARCSTSKALPVSSPWPDSAKNPRRST